MINITLPAFVSLQLNKLTRVKGKFGVYVILDKNESPLYVGKGELFDRLTQHVKRGKTTLFRRYIKTIRYFEVNDPTEREIYETYLINELKPPFNSSKVYSYDSYFAKHKYEKRYKEMEK